VIFCNGFPKSGNHALWKAVELLGFAAGVNHAEFEAGAPKGTTHQVFIKRDPRNVIVSKLRGDQDAVTPGKFLSRMQRFDTASLVDEMRKFEGWMVAMQSLPIHVVRYEDLIADAGTMRALAWFLGVPYLEGAFGELEGHTRTWNKVKSDYREVWTDEVQRRWRAGGGDALLRRWGY
jgi:Sulfotransferase domain